MPAGRTHYTYTYDAGSRLTTEVTNGTTKTFTYDNTDQLTADSTNTFTYDATGNRTNSGYSTGSGNRLTNDGLWTYTYDDEGSRTKRSKGATLETWTYGYDQKNQLLWVEKRATDGGTLQQKVEFKYDAWGNRIEKRVDSDGNGTWDSTQRYAYDGWNPAKSRAIGLENFDVWADLDGSNNFQTKYLRGDIIDQIFARYDTVQGPAWLLTDRMGSVRDVLNNGSVIKDTLVYDGFGNITSETDNTWGGRYKWTGREHDVEINLQYNRARYYDAKTGRWISQDPLGFDAGDSNLYRYVHNQSTRLFDPSGNEEISFGVQQGTGDPPGAVTVLRDGPYVDGQGHWVVVRVENIGGSQFGNYCNSKLGSERNAQVLAMGLMTVGLKDFKPGRYVLRLDLRVEMAASISRGDAKTTTRYTVRKTQHLGGIPNPVIWDVTMKTPPTRVLRQAMSTSILAEVAKGNRGLTQVLVAEPIISFGGFKGDYVEVAHYVRVSSWTLLKD